MKRSWFLVGLFVVSLVVSCGIPGLDDLLGGGTTTNAVVTNTVTNVVTNGGGGGVSTNDSIFVVCDFNFNDGSKDGWEESRRVWHVTNGVYALDGGYLPGYGSSSTRDGYSIWGKGNTSLRSYTLQVDVRGTSSLKKPIILFHVVNWQDDFSKTPFDAYRFDFHPADSSSDAGKWVLQKYVTINGVLQLTTLTNGTSVAFGSGWNRVSISVTEGGEIKIYANGQLVLSYVDPNPIPYGGVGLGCVWETTAEFDNVKISKN